LLNAQLLSSSSIAYGGQRFKDDRWKKHPVQYHLQQVEGAKKWVLDAEQDAETTGARAE
jgi:hypothetical protein